MTVSELINILREVLDKDGDIPVKLDARDGDYKEFAVQINTIPRPCKLNEQVPYVVFY